MAKGETLEETYTRQLQELGIYRKAFDREISLLCQMERELRRVDKAWRAACVEQYGAANEKGTIPKVLDYCHPLHGKIEAMRRDILTHRDSLGLTPKGYKRLRPDDKKTDEAAGEIHPFGQLLAEITAKCAQYE